MAKQSKEEKDPKRQSLAQKVSQIVRPAKEVEKPDRDPSYDYDPEGTRKVLAMQRAKVDAVQERNLSRSHPVVRRIIAERDALRERVKALESKG